MWKVRPSWSKPAVPRGFHCNTYFKLRECLVDTVDTVKQILLGRGALRYFMWVKWWQTPPSHPPPPKLFERKKKGLFNEEERANPCTAMACPENSFNQGSD